MNEVADITMYNGSALSFEFSPDVEALLHKLEHKIKVSRLQ